MSIAIIIFSFLFFLIALEYIYSYKIKDSIYEKKATLVNILNGVILIFISRYFIILYSSIFLNWQLKLNNLNYTVFTFLISLFLVDFFYYVFHRLHHTIKFLWIFHFFHHSDKKLNLSTAYRISWFEQIYEFLFFAPILLLGIHTNTILVSFYILCLYQFICHSQYIKFPHIISYLFVTPQSHAIHHDQEIKNQNSNFGGIFSIWDRLFGTYTEKIESFEPGIKNYYQENLIKIYTDPMLKYVKKLS